MTSKRTQKIAAVEPADGEVTLPGAIDPFVIGPASPAGTPGFYMGIGTRPETAAEHATRLGVAAGKFNDAGFILGTLEPIAGWPGPPYVGAP
jgi:hypothetical protein